MDAWWNKIIPTKNEREVRRYSARVAEINALEPKMQALPDSGFATETARLREIFQANFAAIADPADKYPLESKDYMKAHRQRVSQALDALLPEAFALVREAAVRTLKMRHYDVQLIGAMVLHDGRIAEMKTGEGKTLVATMPAYLNALTGLGVHLVTVNEYLASRDAAWMGQIYEFLGLKVGVISHDLNDEQRQQAYLADITYGTNSEFGFDYLRDNMKLFLQEYTQRGHYFSIVDEVDSILIDEARTPLIISGPAEHSTDKYIRINALIPGLRREQDYSVDEKARSVLLTEAGVHSVEQRLGIDNLYAADSIEFLHHVNQALRAHALYRINVDYMIDDGKVKIIDEFTGRVLDGRRWSDGLHQAVEAKEGVAIENENQTMATITYQNYFRMFTKLSGMTGTAVTEAEEFAKIYDLDVVAIPTNKPVIRDDANDLIYKTEKEKFEAIAEEIQERTTKGQPVLVGTVTVEKSEVLSRHLKRMRIPHSVLNAKFHQHEASIIAQAGRKSSVTIATNMAGRGTDIVLGGNCEAMAKVELKPGDDDSVLQSLIEKHRPVCAKECQAVLTAGGLHILGTERHESRRIDNQLRGRSGRQGDPGSSRFYLSLEDDLIRVFGGDRIQGMMNALGMKDGEVIEHKWVSKSIENAQRKVEGNNFDMRKHLLEYDDVMNEQRKAVYKMRREVLGADVPHTQEMILDLIEELIVVLIQRSCPEKSSYDDWDISGLENMVHEQFDIRCKLENLQELTIDELEDRVFDVVEVELSERAKKVGAESLFGVARIIHLQTIDALWKEHLREMDHLREGIGLRGYAQKDPKQEYKKEGFSLFANMMGTIATDVLMRVFRVVITEDTEDAYEARLKARAQQQKRDLHLGQSRARPNAADGDDVVKTAPVRREQAKIGRNESCPCGSGKKYKKCCMKKNDMHP